MKRERKRKGDFGTLLFSISERSRSGVFHAVHCTFLTLMAYQALCEFKERAGLRICLLHHTQLCEL